MARQTGKYSIVKFIPDDIRQEVINIGVILHVPDNGSFYSRFLDYETRAKHFLTSAQFFEFKTFKRVFSRQIRKSSGKMLDSILNIEPTDITYLDHLTNKLKQPFFMTVPKPAIVLDPEQLLDQLYNLYVFNEEELPARNRPLSEQLIQRFKNAGISDYLITEPIEVKEAPIPIHVDFGFLNGQLNLIQPLVIGEHSRDNLKEGAYWQLALNSIRRSSDLKTSPFFAVVKPPRDPQKASFEDAIRLFEDFEDVFVVNFETNDLDLLIHHIKEHGHPLAH